MAEVEEIEIDTLKLGLPGITPIIGAHLVEACVVSLHRSNHNSNTSLNVVGDQKASYSIAWKDTFDLQTDESWKDQTEATELGAVCLSVLLALKITDYTVIGRSVKKTGFDYWLGKKEDNDDLFQKKARLEVSGIFNGGINEVKSRLKIKFTQTNQSDSLNIPAYVSVIEFSEPLANFSMKK